MKCLIDAVDQRPWSTSPLAGVGATLAVRKRGVTGRDRYAPWVADFMGGLRM